MLYCITFTNNDFPLTNHNNLLLFIWLKAAHLLLC